MNEELFELEKIIFISLFENLIIFIIKKGKKVSSVVDMWSISCGCGWRVEFQRS